MKRKLLLFGLVLALLVPLAGAQALANAERLNVTVNDIDATLQNDWFGVYCQDKKVGFNNEASEKLSKDGQTFYRLRKQAQLKLLALGQKGEVKFEQTLDFAAAPPFALLGGEYLIDDGQSRKHIKLVAKSEGYEATLTVGKNTQKRMLKRVDFTLADVVSPAVWLKKGPAKHETMTFRDFDFADLTMSQMSMKVLGTTEIVHGGAKVKVNEVERIDHHGGSKSTALYRYDSNGRVVSGVEGGTFEMRRESEADAKRTEFGDDLIFANMAKLDRLVGDLQKVKGLTLKGKGKANGLLPESALQTITREADDTYVVKIGKHHAKAVKAAERELQEALEETTAYPIRDAKVIELAKKAVGDARTDQDKVNRLCRFVHEYIKYEIVYVPKVDDILERKVGDCKSYALFFTTLARAAGLPAREACGFLYMGDDVKGFGGHAWNEVVIDGHWVPIDATIGHTDLLPFYICVGTGRHGHDNMTQANGKLSFQLVDVERVQ